jgi:hypothetical protein
MTETSPWMTLKEAGRYARRGPRFLAREIKAGRLRAARVGGRGEYLTRGPWVDQWLEDLATPVLVSGRRPGR